MTPRLRPVGARDLPGLAALHALCFAPDERWDVPALAQVLAMPGAGGSLAADEAGEPRGLILHLMLPGEVEILTLGVHPAARRHGFARALLDDLLARGRRAGAQRVVLEVAADNIAARRLYETSGFRIAGRRPDYYRRRGRSPVDAWLLSRRLGDPGEVAC